MTGDLTEFYRMQRQRDIDLYRVRRHFNDAFGEYPPVDLTVEEVTALHIERLRGPR